MKRLSAIFLSGIISTLTLNAAWTTRDFESFDAATVRTQNSYHNADNQLAVAPNTLTLNDAVRVSYTWKTGEKAGQTENLLKVTTWTWNYACWTSEGAEWNLATGSSYPSFPWVTLAGNSDKNGDMQNYFQTNYAGISDAETAYDKVWHTLGMKESTSATQTRILAEFLVSEDDIIRPAFQWDATKNTTTPATNAEGLFIAESVSGLSHDILLSAANSSTYTVSNSDEYSMQIWLDANRGTENTYPYTAMGYTYNTDPDRASTDPTDTKYIGLSEFLINGNANIVNYSVIGETKLDLYNYLYNIPEPSAFALIFGFIVIGFVIVRRHKC